MLTRRIIPCLDVHRGQTVKGVQFMDLQPVGDPVQLGQLYAQQGADELAYLDISATVESRRAWEALIRRVARQLNIPFMVGGGVRAVDDVERMLRAGADKVSVNSAAVREPELVSRLSREFGSQCIVVAIDARKENGDWWVYTHGGRRRTAWRALDWAMEVTQRGAGEILLTSMNHDGSREGFAVEIVRRLAEALPIPVIASGGAGKKEHFLQLFRQGRADAALAASVFHFGHMRIDQLKHYLKENGIEVRL